MKKLWFGIALLVASLAVSEPASACILCAYSGGNGPECELVYGETGGSSCFINCGTSGGIFKCYCRTLGNCGGSNECNGQPCPVARKDLGSFTPEKKRASVFLTHRQLAELETVHPEAARLLVTFAKDADALLVGLKEAIPFVPGDYQGMITEAPILEGGVHGAVRVYRYEATVIQEEDGVTIRAEIFEHPTMRRLFAQIRNGAFDNLLDLTSPEGRTRRFQL